MDSETKAMNKPASLPSLEEQKAYWNDRWEKLGTPNEWQIRRSREIISFLQSLKLDRPKILDIGCGTGWFTAALNDFGEATGIDLSETAIQQAKSDHPGVDYRSVNLYDSPFPDEYFDTVVAMEVLPHVEDQIRFIKIISSILKPGGYLAFSMVNKFAINRSKWDHGPESHIIHWLSMRDLKRLLCPDFKILKRKTVIPIGDRGILKLINSSIINEILKTFFAEDAVVAFKERLGCGYSRVILAKKIR